MSGCDASSLAPSVTLYVGGACKRPLKLDQREATYLAATADVLDLNTRRFHPGSAPANPRQCGGKWVYRGPLRQQIRFVLPENKSLSSSPARVGGSLFITTLAVLF